MIKKLRVKFIAAAMLAMFIVLAVMIGAINVINYNKVIKDADNLLKILSDNDGTFPKDRHPKDFPKNFSEADARFLSPETPYETRYFTVRLSLSGTALSVNTGNIAAISTSDAISYANSIYSSSGSSGFYGNYRYLRVDSPQDILMIFVDCTPSLSNFRNFLLTSILMAVIGLISVLILVILFSKIIFRPVAESFRKQKQFITNAGHELKTPLTIIDANTEVLEMTGGENEWTASIKNQTRRLAALTGELVTLTRLDEGSQPMVKSDISLSDAVEETAEGFFALAVTRNIELSVHVEPGISFCGDEKSLRQLTGILLDNALKYSDSHGRISLTLKKHGRGCSLIVYNTAPDIDKAHLDQIFERFYRLDSSRNSSVSGYGLGLSIAQSITAAHKGKIFAKSEDGQSLTITVQL